MHKDEIEGYRLSPQQEHLWLLQRGEDSMSYRARCIVTIEGELDVGILRLALQKVVRRHEILRTSFHQLPEMDLPIQVIDEYRAPHLDEQDLSGIEEAEQHRILKALGDEIARAAVDSQGVSLLRLSLATLAASRHVLLIGLPVLCLDGKGLENLVREISETYQASLEGREEFEDPLQYADLSEWQNELLEVPETAAGREYWRSQNLSVLLSKQLPSEARSRLSERFEPRTFVVEIDQVTSHRINDLVGKEASAVSALLLACWNILLWRLTGETDVLVGALYDGRKNYELSNTIGLLARYLPIHARLRTGQTFNQARELIMYASQEGTQWQEYFSWQEISDSPSASLFFDFCFDYEEQPQTWTGKDLAFSISHQRACISRFKVKLRCIWREDSLRAELHYDAGLFCADDARRLAEGFRALLESALLDPQRSIDTLAVLGPFERNQVTAEFNRTEADYPDNLCVHEWFETQARLTPHNTAVIFESQSLTFAQLEEKANQLARHLRNLGATLESPVGLCVERSLEMVVGLLGILKAGCAYVPLDAEYPTERLNYMLEDAGVELLLTQEKFSERLQSTRARLVCLDSPLEGAANPAELPVSVSVTPDNLAYVIYTSGSTGQPKGVMITHRALCNHMAWILRTFAFDAKERVLGKTPFSFDASVWEFYAPLLVGGVLVLARPGGQREPDYLAEIIERQKITVVQLVPTLLRELLKEARSLRLKSLRHLFCGGEVLPLDLQERFFERVDAELHNLYGPTEACVDTTFWTSKPCVAGTTVPIGRPIFNVRTYVVDRHLQLASIGVAGELVIGGVGLGRGYFAQRELTAEKFIPDPFSQELGARLFRTGDLARYLPDGNLEFLGRNDYQMKFRGFRIELGEIESVLRRHAGVIDAVVVVKAGVEDKQRLLAYIVPQKREARGASSQPLDGLSEDAISVSELRVFLEEKLPDYMIPSGIVFLTELPLTPNGKVDRQALPEPDEGRPMAGQNYVSPRSYAENELARIWSEALGLPKVGIRDNFFELGGDSILSIQIVAKAQNAGLPLTPRQIFQHQNIEALAAVIGTAPLTLAEQQEVTGEVPLTPIQREFFEQQGPQPHFNQALLLRLVHRVEPRWVRAVMERLLIHHDALRLRFRGTGDDWVQFHCAASELAQNPCCLYLDLRAIASEKQKQALADVAFDVQRSLDLEHGPMFRSVLCELGAKDGQRLLLVAHHLLVDGVSWRILLEDMDRGIEQASCGEEISFGAKTTSFKQWAIKLQHHALSEELAAQEMYWRAETDLATVGVPVDYVAKESRFGDAAEVAVELSEAETGTLLREVAEVYQTQVNEVLLVGLSEALRRWTGSRRVRVQMEGHGREQEVVPQADVTRTVGWFTTLYPLVIDCGDEEAPANAEPSCGWDVEERIKRAREKVRNIPDRGIGYGLLKYMSGRALVSQPAEDRASVSFNYLGQLDHVMREGGWLKAAEESAGPSQSTAARRSSAVEITGMVIGGRLQMRWAYSTEMHRKETIERVAQWQLEALRDVVRESRKANVTRGYSPSDFSIADLKNQTLAEILSNIAAEN